MTSDQTVFDDSSIHDKWAGAYRGGGQQAAFNDQLFRKIVRHVEPDPGARVLDAGCGTGEHTIRWAKRGHRVIGVDLSESVLERARNVAAETGLTSKCIFLRCGVQDLSRFPDGAFDVVHCRGVLMHVPEWLIALRELCRVLRTGGRMVLLENNKSAVEFQLVRLLRLFRKGASRMVPVEGGIEFHPRSGTGPITRFTDFRFLRYRLDQHGVRIFARFDSGFWDVGRFPEGLPRDLATMFNRCWLAVHGPAAPSLGNAVVGEKMDNAQTGS